MLRVVADLGGTSWGTVPGWATLVVLLIVGWIMLRGGAGQAVEGLQATNRELQRQITELQTQVTGLTNENAELRGRTDVAIVMKPVIEAVTSHERQAERRSAAMLSVLDLIATRLGKDDEE